jgi:cell division protein FtsI (penicillin-binding protein 3)
LETDKERKFRRKGYLLLTAFLLLFALPILTIFRYQSFPQDKLIKALKERFPRVDEIEVFEYRGSIRDRIGRELALSVPTLSVFAKPVEKVRNADKLAERLSLLTGVEESKIRRRLRTKGYSVLLKRVDNSLKGEILRVIRETNNTELVGIQEGYSRLYAYNTLASNLIGFIGDEGKGLEGLEYKFDNLLGGGVSRLLIYRSKSLGIISLKPIRIEDLEQAHDVEITIDVGLQSILEDIRDKIVSRWKPKKVSILLIDIRKGDILGLATYPYYDPNRFSDYPAESRRNYVVTDLFEPGSVMKPFFVAYALDRGKVSPWTKINTGKGRTKVYGRWVRDYKPLGKLSLREVIVKSSNVGTIEVAKRLSKQEVRDMIERFHLHKTFGILPGEAKPKIPDFTYPANILYSSIGQGIAFNTLHITTAFGALATGYVVKPRILRKVIISGKAEREEIKRTEILRKEVLSDKTLRWIRKSLIQVVERGTGKRARSKFFTIAGKTGTSQKFDFKLGRYSRDKVVAYFIGFFPATNPRFVAAIVVDEPKGKRAYGGTVAAPYFRELVERTAFYTGLKPDK